MYYVSSSVNEADKNRTKLTRVDSFDSLFLSNFTIPIVETIKTLTTPRYSSSGLVPSHLVLVLKHAAAMVAAAVAYVDKLLSGQIFPKPK